MKERMRFFKLSQVGRTKKKPSFETVAIVLFIFFAYFGSAWPAFGSAILSDDNRSISTHGSWGDYCIVDIVWNEETQSWEDVYGWVKDSWDIFEKPQTTFGDFDESVSKYLSSYPVSGHVFAEQNSTITPNLFTATGSVECSLSVFKEGGSSGSAQADVFVESLFEVGFDLLNPHQYELSGTYEYWWAGCSLSLELEQVGVGTILHETTYDSVTQNGILRPGYYLLSASISGSAGLINMERYDCDGTYNLYFKVNEIPEPSTLWMLASLFIGLVGMKCKLCKRKLLFT